MIQKLPGDKTYAADLTDGHIREKINEMIDKINYIEEQLISKICTSPLKRYYREDYGHRYEVDENGNPVILPITIVGGPQ